MEFSKLKIFIIFFVCAVVFLITMGNFFNLGIFSKNRVHLGLDLKGGSQILLKIDYDNYVKTRLSDAMDELKSDFRKQQIKVVPRLRVEENKGNRENFISFTLNDDKELKKVKELVKKIDSDLLVLGDRNISIKYDESALNKMKYKLLQQSIEIVTRRIDETGTKEPIIQAQGRDRILVQVPGMESPDELKKVLGKTAKMTFHFVNTNAISDANLPNNVVKMQQMNGFYQYYIEKKVILNGDMLQDANATYSEGKPAVSFKLNSSGAAKFADITKNNIGKILAIVLDDEVITAPRINSVIPNGTGIISGNFTTEEANQVALLLRAGALPAPLEIIEERVVGPSLGQDSIKTGLQACAIGMVFVLAFMIFLYKGFGFIVNITLFVNLCFTMAVLSLLNATLTLPGIAGLVLAIGMAVDSNVLIFERIKEEYHNTGKVYNSVESGFDFAWITIFDSNITMLLISVILYFLGTGAVRGFALILAVGIFASLFSGVLLTKLLMYFWLTYCKPKTINI